MLERASGTHKYSVQLPLCPLTSTFSVVCLFSQVYFNTILNDVLRQPGFISLLCLVAQRKGMVINMRKKICSLAAALIFSIIVAFFTESVITDSAVSSLDHIQTGEVYSLTDTAAISYEQYSDYYYSRSKALPLTVVEDGLVCVDFPATEIGSVKIVFSEPLPEDSYITLSFSDASQTDSYDQHKTMRMLCHEGDEYFMASLPVRAYTHIDFYIDGCPKINNILYSRENLSIVRREFSFLEAVIILAALFAALTFVILKFPKVSEHISGFVVLLAGRLKCSGATALRFCVSIAVSCSAAVALEALFSSMISSEFNSRRIFLFAFAALIFFILIFTRKTIEEKTENAAFLLTLALGGMIAFTGMSNATSFDGDYHYSCAVKASYMFSSQAVITEADAYVINTGECFFIESSDDGQKLSFRNDFSQEANKNSNESLKFAYTNGNFYKTKGLFGAKNVAYIPFGIMLFIGRMLHLPFPALYIFGKLGGVLTYSTLIYFAVKHLTSRKLLVTTAALLPVPVYLAGNYSCDPWITGFIFLGFSYFIEEFKKPDSPLALRKSVIMLGSFVLGMAPKAIYFPLILLTLLLPKQKFSSLKKNRIFKISVVILTALVASMIFTTLASPENNVDLRGGSNVNSLEQVKNILSNPFAYIGVVVNHLITFFSPDNLIYYFGDYKTLGTADTFYCVSAAALLLFTVMIDTDDRNSFEISEKAMKIFKFCDLAAFLVVALLIVTSLYAGFNNVGSKLINGVQARYYMPCFLPFSYLITKGFVLRRPDFKYYSLIVLSAVSLIDVLIVVSFCVV